MVVLAARWRGAVYGVCCGVRFAWRVRGVVVGRVRLVVGVVSVVALGASAALAATAFDDVGSGSFYEDATAWAKDEGLTVGCNSPGGGVAGTEFCPNSVVNRAQNITFTYRHQTLVIDPLLDDIRGDVAAIAAAAAAAQAAVDEVADEVAAGRQRAALLQWSDWQGTIAYGNNPWGVAFDGSHIWVANYGGASVSKIPAG